MILSMVINVVATAETVAATSKGDMIVRALIISLVIGLIIGLIRAMSLKSQLVSVYKNDSAADYTKDNSFKLEFKHDAFLYSKTEKEEKPQQNQAKAN